jgi:hypothetical protein
MPSLTLKPSHKAVTAYYDSLAKFAKLGIKHETTFRSAFQELLEHCARQFDWKLVPEYRLKRKGHADASADGALLDNYGIDRAEIHEPHEKKLKERGKRHCRQGKFSTASRFSIRFYFRVISCVSWFQLRDSG